MDFNKDGATLEEDKELLNRLDPIMSKKSFIIDGKTLATLIAATILTVQRTIPGPAQDRMLDAVENALTVYNEGMKDGN